MSKIPSHWVLKMRSRKTAYMWFEPTTANFPNGGSTPFLERTRKFKTRDEAQGWLDRFSGGVCNEGFVVTPVFPIETNGVAELAPLLRGTTTPVYFIYSEESNNIKIGKSWDVGKRLKELQTGSSCALKVLAVTTKYSEESLHARFEQSRVNGEWFKPSPELCGLIAELR